MVNFETEVYNRQDDDVIGVKVIVVADNGQTIESIRCINETDFQELKAKLDVLDESYVVFANGSSLAGLNIDTILANANEAATINATLLGGHQSDYYAKSGHEHKKANITDLYTYDISLSKYNVSITDSETVSVTVKVIDSTNSPVSGEKFSIYKNGDLWKSNVKTNSKGLYTANFTPTDAGLVTFSVNNQKVQLNVESGWETVNANISGGTLKVNRALKLVSFHGQKTVKFDTKKSESLGTIPAGYTPPRTVRQLAHGSINSPLIFIYVGRDGNVDLNTSQSGQTNNRTADWDVVWSLE